MLVFKVFGVVLEFRITYNIYNNFIIGEKEVSKCNNSNNNNNNDSNNNKKYHNKHTSQNSVRISDHR